MRRRNFFGRGCGTIAACKGQPLDRRLFLTGCSRIRGLSLISLLARLPPRFPRRSVSFRQFLRGPVPLRLSASRAIPAVMYNEVKRTGDREWFSRDSSVDVDVSLTQFDSFARQTNDTLDAHSSGKLWTVEHDRFPAVRLAPEKRRAIDQQSVSRSNRKRTPGILKMSTEWAGCQARFIQQRLGGRELPRTILASGLAVRSEPRLRHRRSRDPKWSNEAIDKPGANDCRGHDQQQEDLDRPPPHGSPRGHGELTLPLYSCRASSTTISSCGQPVSTLHASGRSAVRATENCPVLCHLDRSPCR